MDQTLERVDPPVCVHEEHITDKPFTLVIDEKLKSLRGGDFNIEDLDGNVVAKCEGKTFMRGKRVITDSNGRELYSMRKQLAHIHATYIAEDNQGNEIVRVVKAAFNRKQKMDAKFFNPVTKQEQIISLRGGFWAVSADLTLGPHGSGPVVAQLHRNFFTKKDIFAGKQKYYVLVAPGVDISLIACIAIFFNQSLKDNRRHGGGGGAGGSAGSG